MSQSDSRFLGPPPHSIRCGFLFHVKSPVASNCLERTSWFLCCSPIEPKYCTRLMICKWCRWICICIWLHRQLCRMEFRTRRQSVNKWLDCGRNSAGTCSSTAPTPSWRPVWTYRTTRSACCTATSILRLRTATCTSSRWTWAAITFSSSLGCSCPLWLRTASRSSSWVTIEWAAWPTESSAPTIVKVCRS